MVKETCQKVFWGWWIVLTSSLISLYGMGTFHYGFSVFVHPIVSEMGWSMALVSGAFSLYRLESGVTAPIAGYLIDLIGPRMVVMFGAILMGIGYVYLSQIRTVLPFYLAFLIISIGFAFGTGLVVHSSLISKWFIRKRGKALGLYSAFYALGGLLVPVLSHLILLYGWRTTLLILGPATWFVIFPLAFLLRRNPEEHGLLPDGELSIDFRDSSNLSTSVRGMEINYSILQAMHMPSYWVLTICFSLYQMTMSAMFVHMVPYLITVGFEIRLAALVMTCVTVASVIGRAGFGWLGDLINKKALLMICFMVQSMGILIITHVASNTSLLYVISYILGYGLTYGGIAVLRPAVVADLYGREKFGTIWGILQGISIFGGVAGPVFVGFIYDIHKSYRLGFIILSLINLFAFFLIIFLKRPDRRDPNGSKLSSKPEGWCSARSKALG